MKNPKYTASPLSGMIDKLSGGYGAWVERAFSYLLIGGLAACVNLAIFYLVYYRIAWPANQQWHYIEAFALATEVSILANFVLNDRITFRHLPGHSRPWYWRCLRFHVTCALGTLLTLCISFSLHLLNTPALLAQASAIAIVTAFNFTFHHIFTYSKGRSHEKVS